MGNDRASLLVSSSDDCLARVYDYRDHSLMGTLIGHTDKVTSSALALEKSNHQLICTGSRDQSINIYRT